MKLLSIFVWMEDNIVASEKAIQIISNPFPYHQTKYDIDMSWW